MNIGEQTRRETRKTRDDHLGQGCRRQGVKEMTRYSRLTREEEGWDGEPIDDVDESRPPPVGYNGHFVVQFDEWVCHFDALI
jgi:hypothetical protein